MPNWIQHKHLLLLTVNNVTPLMILMHNWGKQLQHIITIIYNFASNQYTKNNIHNIRISQNMQPKYPLTLSVLDESKSGSISMSIVFS